jgi:hypothetical protein
MGQKPATKPSKKPSNVGAWIKSETLHKREALENASRHFDSKDSLTVNTLEAIYGQESSFGKNRRSRGISGAAGDFQIEKNTAKEMGLTVSNKNDERFDIDNSSAAAAKYLKTQDANFSKKTTLVAGATSEKTKEISDYVDSVLKYESEFAEKSNADKKAKSGRPKKVRRLPTGGHRITLNGNHIFIED